MERDGVDGLTIRALSAQADVSPTSIYQHIGGKQAVCDALIDTYFTDLPSSLVATALEKKVQREYSAKLHELVRNGQVAA